MKMKTAKSKIVEQPVTFTPGVTRAMVREHTNAFTTTNYRNSRWRWKPGAG